MGIEETVANKKGNELLELKKGKNLTSSPNPNLKPSTTNGRRKKGRGRNQKKAVMVVSPAQKLYDTCKEVFAFGGTGVVPSPENVERLRAVIDDIKATDFGLNPDMPHFLRTSSKRIPIIRYLHLFENDKFSMGIFCLPPSGVIPLHNHPGMTVFSKLLFGTMHIKSYDWVVGVPSEAPIFANSSGVEQNKVPESRVRLAQVKVNSDFTAPCSATILYPADGGNMHCFTAKTACAVLDVLGPPYSSFDGRHCTYYSDYSFASFTGGLSIPEEEMKGYAWLQESEKPEDLAVLGQMYAGPRIVE